MTVISGIWFISESKHLSMKKGSEVQRTENPVKQCLTPSKARSAAVSALGFRQKKTQGDAFKVSN